jgi:hypothetical protein
MENEFVEWGSWGAFVVDLSVCWLGEERCEKQGAFSCIHRDPL